VLVDLYVRNLHSTIINGTVHLFEFEVIMNEVLKWCAENEVTIKITDEDGLLAVTAKYTNLFAEYAIPEPCSPEAVGRTVHAACYSVKCGAEYRERHGDSNLTGKGIS
jgi:hypothetical protein